jgi:histidinol-phosphate aminotransferase
MKEIKPPKYIENLKPYKNSSHKVWEHIYQRDHNHIEGVLKLDWNESVRIPDDIIKKIFNYIVDHKIRLNWYPDVNNLLLLKKLSEYIKLPIKNIQYFNGSDSALEYIIKTYLEPGSKVVMASPTYDNFRVYVQSCGAKPIFYFNPSLFKKSIKKIDDFLAKQKPKLIYIANPNNPTGLLYDNEEINKVLSKFPKILFVIDEAYGEFCNHTCASLVKKHKNLIIVKTFTKAFGLGAFRLGYVIADESIINNLNKIRVGKGISTFAQAAGIVALDNIEYMRKYVDEVGKSKKKLADIFEKYNINFFMTPANFVLIECKNPSKIAKIFEQNQIFIRDVSNLPQMEKYIRVTIGDLKTTGAFIKIFEEILKKYGSSIF